jgi:hypothetical protein
MQAETKQFIELKTLSETEFLLITVVCLKCSVFLQ